MKSIIILLINLLSILILSANTNSLESIVIIYKINVMYGYNYYINNNNDIINDINNFNLNFSFKYNNYMYNKTRKYLQPNMYSLHVENINSSNDATNIYLGLSIGNRLFSYYESLGHGTRIERITFGYELKYLREVDNNSGLNDNLLFIGFPIHFSYRIRPIPITFGTVVSTNINSVNENINPFELMVWKVYLKYNLYSHLN